MDVVLNQHASPGKRLLGGAIGIVVVLVLYLGFASEAQATEQTFCPKAAIGAYGQPNDNCAAGEKHWNYQVRVVAEDHSACASTSTNGAKSGVNLPWTCTVGAPQILSVWVSPDVFTVGILRNNTTGDINHVTGVQAWCSIPGCG